jgi:hypothetical protein
MFVKILAFKIMLSLGYITPMNEDNEGRELYTLRLSDGKVMEYVYREEVFLYMETGEFQYNEDYLYYDTQVVEDGQ